MNEIKINSLSNLSESLQRLSQTKGVSEEKIKNIICQSFRQFYEKKLNQTVDFHFEFGDKFSVYRLYQIVEKVSDPEKEIDSSDWRLKEGKSENNIFFLPLEITSFDLASEIKKMVQEELKKISWESQSKLLQKFQQEEKLVQGNLQGLRGDYYLVNLNLGEEGRVIGLWEKKEWTSTQQQPRLGQRLLFLIKQVDENPTENQPPLLLTRASDAFCLQVLKLEIPELKEGIIVVRQILRSPREIKVVVESKKKGVNPLGTCIGVEAMRIKRISRSLFPQQIDIVPWIRGKENLERREKPPEEVASYKNIQLRTSEENSGQKENRPWTKKFNNKI